MTSARFDELFEGPPRRPADPLDQRTLDIAASIQLVTEDIVLRIARALRAESGETRLCLAGGVALNCVANGRLLRESGFAELWIQPAAGDAGGALGAALLAWHRGGGARAADGVQDGMQGALLGPHYPDGEVREFLRNHGLPCEELDEDRLPQRVAQLLAAGAVVGWVQGRMEFGPRALGSRSILADPRAPAMQRTLNLKIKFRESFRPFAPAVPEERVAEYFELERSSPYMLLVAKVRGAASARSAARGLARQQAIDSPLPAVTHVDDSARVQTVSRACNPRFHALLESFGALTGVPVLVNTSFNVRGEPIVCSLADAWRCFMATGMDALVLGRCLLLREAQPAAHPLAAAPRDFAED